jgi:hypothetical protein
MPDPTETPNHACPFAGTIPMILRELDQMRDGFRTDLREQDARLLRQIDERFGIKLQACEGLEERVNGHQTRLDLLEKAKATQAGKNAVHRSWSERLISFAALVISAVLGGIVSSGLIPFVKH